MGDDFLSIKEAGKFVGVKPLKIWRDVSKMKRIEKENEKEIDKEPRPLTLKGFRYKISRNLLIRFYKLPFQIEKGIEKENEKGEKEIEKGIEKEELKKKINERAFEILSLKNKVKNNEGIFKKEVEYLTKNLQDQKKILEKKEEELREERKDTKRAYLEVGRLQGEIKLLAEPKKKRGWQFWRK